MPDPSATGTPGTSETHATPGAPVSPALFWETINGFQRTGALKAAIELELFTTIGGSPATPGDLAQRCKASERGMRILCDYLTTLGFLTKSQALCVTPDSGVFLNKKSPAYLGGTIGFLLNPKMMDLYDDVAAAVRRGGAAPDQGTLHPEDPVWVDFARSMAPMMQGPAQHMAKMAAAGHNGAMKVLDIAAGHGLFGVTVAQHVPGAQIVALDWANVLAVAQENARAAKVDSRYRTLPGSAFEVPFGSDYDLILLTNFLHHFDAPMCQTLLRKCHAALKPGGRVFTLEFVPNDDRITPPDAAMFSMVMLNSTPSGDAYTFAELQKMAANAGFRRSELHAMAPTPQSVVVSYK